MAAIEALLTIIPNELAQGNIVELGDFGHFWLRFHAEEAEDPAQVRGDQIWTLILRFTPGKRFWQTLHTVKFQKKHRGSAKKIMTSSPGHHEVFRKTS